MPVRKALMFMLISATAFAFLSISVKSLIHLGSFELVFFRCLGTSILANIYLRSQKISPFGNERRLLIYRSVSGLIAMSMFYLSLNYLAVGTSVALRYTSPIFATFFAVLFLKERVKHIQWLFFLISFSGVLVMKGFDPNINTTGFIIIMFTAIFSGLAYISIRKIGNRDHPVVIVNYFMTFGAVVSGFIAIPMWVQPQGSEWILAGSLGVIGFVAQYFMTRAFQIAHTYVVAPMKYVEMVFTVLLGMMLLGERYSMYSFLGTLLIVGGLLLNIRFSTVGASKKKSI